MNTCGANTVSGVFCHFRKRSVVCMAFLGMYENLVCCNVRVLLYSFYFFVSSKSIQTKCTWNEYILSLLKELHYCGGLYTHKSHGTMISI